MSIHCHWDLHVECFYVDDGGYLRDSRKAIAVAGYWDGNPFTSCWPKPGTSATMDTACAALGPVNGYTLFASTWEGQQMPESGCDFFDYWYDSNNKVCGSGVYKEAPHSGMNMKGKLQWGKPAQKPSPLKQEQPNQARLRFSSGELSERTVI